MAQDFLLTLHGEETNGKLPFYNQGQLHFKDPRTLRPVLIGDQPLLIREPKTEVILPTVSRTLSEFTKFADQHGISLVKINIQELVTELAKRVRLLSGHAINTDVVWAPLESSVTE